MSDHLINPSVTAPPAELADVDLYHPRSWWTMYVFSQDAKIIAIQYSITAMAIGLVCGAVGWLLAKR